MTVTDIDTDRVQHLIQELDSELDAICNNVEKREGPNLRQLAEALLVRMERLPAVKR